MTCQSHTAMFSSSSRQDASPKRKEVSLAALVTGLVLAVFAADSLLGDALWAAISEASGDASFTSTLNCPGTQWRCMECAGIALAVLMVVGSGFFTRRHRDPKSSPAPSLPKARSTSPASKVHAHRDAQPLLKWRAMIEKAARDGNSDRAMALFS